MPEGRDVEWGTHIPKQNIIGIYATVCHRVRSLQCQGARWCAGIHKRHTFTALRVTAG